MPVITLTTDWGIRDHYVGALKGALLRAVPGVQLIDISNLVSVHNIVQGTYIFKNAFKHFPDNTIHFVGIDVPGLRKRQLVAIEHNRQFFVGIDTGFFAIVLDTITPQKVVSINTQNQRMSKYFVPTVAAIANGKPLEALGEEIECLFERKLHAPMIDAQCITGAIIYEDEYCNLVTNIDFELFENARKGRRFEIKMKSIGSLSSFSRNYDEVADGELVALINDSGLIEIAVNNGKASRLFNLKIGTNIRIEFYDNTHRKTDHPTLEFS